MRKSKKIDFEIDDNNCFILTSHHNSAERYSLISINNEIMYIHRFVYQQCFGEIPKGLLIRHKCDNPRCINPEHLETGTVVDNSRDMIERNRSLKGSKNPKSKLNEREVRQIKAQLGKKKNVQIAKEFNVSPDTISNIKAGRIWKHVI